MICNDLSKVVTQRHREAEIRTWQPVDRQSDALTIVSPGHGKSREYCYSTQQLARSIVPHASWRGCGPPGAIQLTAPSRATTATRAYRIDH